MKDGSALREIINTLNAQGKMVFLGGASEEQILEFESNNDIVLPAFFYDF